MIPYVSPEDFGAVGDGVTDDTVALQNAVNGAANNGLVLSGTYLISATITLPSDIEILGTATGRVLSQTPDISLFLAALESNIRITGVQFEQDAIGTDPYTGGVVLDRCTDCLIADCEFEGMQWAGAYLSNASRNILRGNHFHDFQSGRNGVNDGADIVLYNNSNENEVSGNQCLGGGDHGILIQDPYSETWPSKNLISGNHVGEHDGYGIVVYAPFEGDTFNTITGNDIEDILGTHLAGDSGAGIYLAGTGCGGTLIADNNIRNCCRESETRSLTPAAIGINGLSASGARVLVSGNDIADMEQGDGILISTSPGVTVTGNAVRIPAGNNGGGTGGMVLVGAGIRVENSSNVAVAANLVSQAGSGGGILLYANGVTIADLAVTGNTVSAVGTPLRTARTSSFVLESCVVAGNVCRVSGAVDGMQLEGIARGSVSGNAVSCGGIPLYVAASTNLRISGNSLSTSGATGFQTGGTCTGTFYALSNLCNGAIVNAGSGSRTEFFTTAVPASGTAAVGDRAVQSAPTSGAPDYWRCVTAGSPGTWKAGANLA